MFESLQNSVTQYWTGIYLRFLSLCLLYGAFVHLGNIFGLGEVPWLETPIYWRLMDIILLVFNAIVSVSLWLKTVGGMIAFTVGIIFLQIIPYTLFRQFFIVNPQDGNTLNGLIGTEIILIILLAILIISKK